MSIYSHRDVNVRKTWLLVTLFFVFIIGVGWVFAEAQGDPTILYIAVIFSIFMNVLSYWYSDKIVLKLTRARPASREEFFDLYTVVENLSITAGLPMPKVYVVDDPAPNAFATGRNEKHAVVAVTTGLLGILNRTELEGVIAHELSHIGNKDMLLSTMVVVLVGFISILSDFFLRGRFYRFASTARRGENRAPGILIFIGLLLALVAPLIATLIRMTISRKREFLADASGALLTRYPEGLASALEKISAHNQPMQIQHSVVAHLFIANPLEQGILRLFMTHPPIDQRIRALREMS